jgi:hypothetical protein
MDWNQATGQCAEAQLKAAGIGGMYQPPTKRQQLEKMKYEVEQGLGRITDAIAALDAHPELEEFINTLQKAGV